MRRSDIIQVFMPEVPDTTKAISGNSISGLVLLQNIADRLTELRHDYTAEPSVLDTVSMSMDGLTHRLTLKKGYTFHCGAEVTAADAVATLLAVIKDEQSVSQLHCFVDGGGPKSKTFAVQETSRYRFEIRLKQRLPDLLVRLSLPEFSLRHDGGTCYSGLWRVSGRDSNGLVLSANEQHPASNSSSYRQVRWEKATDPGEMPLPITEAPFLYLYSGTQFKSPPDEILIDEQCRDLDYGSSLMLSVRGNATLATAARIRSFERVERFVAPTSLWRRSALFALVPRQHVLHHRFNVVRGFDGPGETRSGRKKINGFLIVDDNDADKPLLTRYARFAREQLDIDLAIVNKEPVNKNPTDLLITPIRCFSGLPGDYLTPINSVKQALPEISFQGLNNPRAGTAAFQFCQDLLINAPLMPVVYSPFVIRTNRTLRKSERNSVLRFSDIRGVVDPSVRRNLNDAMLKSLGAAVQMFAHDIKRPFSMMQGMLGMLNSATDPQRISDLSAKFLPNLEQATRYADGLIHDVLEIGSDTEPDPVELNLREIILSTLEEVFGTGSFPGIEFKFDITHSRLAMADARKIARVFTNLVANAAEAMKSDGTLTFQTHDDPDHDWIIVSITNTGSSVPEEVRAGIFDRFYTSGKARGTGLGLAIVKKIVTDHGCSVWCTSDEDKGTTFSFTLARSQVQETEAVCALPVTSAELYRKKWPEPPAHENTASRKHQASAATSKVLEVLVVDDDAIYSDMLRALIDEAGEGFPIVNLITAFNYEQAVIALRNKAFDAAIVDVDLGGPEDGLSLVRLIRLDQSELRICVHSSGPVFELQKRSLESGADAFIPKPMTGALFRAFVGTIVDAVPTIDAGTIIVVDDDPFMLEQWEEIKGYGIVTFSSPESLLSHYNGARDLPNDLLAFVLDFSFTGSTLNGVQLAEEIVSKHGKRNIFLATDRPMKATELGPNITAVVAKLPEATLKKLK